MANIEEDFLESLDIRHEDDNEQDTPEGVVRLFELMQMDNIAEDLNESELTKIGSTVLGGYEADLDSRESKQWDERYDEIMKLATLALENKTSSNDEVGVQGVVYPMIISAAIQFSSRAMPNIIKGKDVAKFVTVGADAYGEKASRAERLSQDMSCQLLYETKGWVDDFDQLLITLPVIGVMFRKIYETDDGFVSELIFPKDVVVSYFTKSIHKAERISHRSLLSRNEIIEKQREGIFLDIDIDSFGQPDGEIGDDEASSIPADDTTVPYELIEQHCLIDLDKDGYAEPYIVTIHKESQKILRIVARFDEDGVILNKKEQVVRIDPIQYFTLYQFMKSPDGSIYGAGFGTLLQPLNEAVNVMLQQLIDAGEGSNWPSGFVSNDVEFLANQGGTRNSLAFKRREFKRIRCTGDDIRKNVHILTMPEPSGTLFNLMQYLLDASEKLTSFSEILSGEMPGPNTPVGTTSALIEQGLKVMSGIYGRIYRAFTNELNIIRRINQKNRTQWNYQVTLDDPNADVQADYNDADMDVFPVTDPANISDTQKMLKAQALMELLGKGMDDREILKEYLNSMSIPDPKRFLHEETKPSPAEEMEMQKMMLEIQKIQAETALINKKAGYEAEKARTEEVNRYVKAEGVLLDKQKMLVEKAKVANEIRRGVVDDELKTKISEMKGKSAEKASQGPYREKGMKSNNKDLR